jgi:hypothetical protein
MVSTEPFVERTNFDTECDILSACCGPARPIELRRGGLQDLGAEIARRVLVEAMEQEANERGLPSRISPSCEAKSVEISRCADDSGQSV